MAYEAAKKPLFRKLDNYLLHVSDLEEAISFRPVQFELMADARASLLAWLERRGGTVEDYAFPSRINRSAPVSTRQYARLVDEWVSAIGLQREEYGTHSLRRTKASII